MAWKFVMMVDDRESFLPPLNKEVRTRFDEELHNNLYFRVNVAENNFGRSNSST